MEKYLQCEKASLGRHQTIKINGTFSLKCSVQGDKILNINYEILRKVVVKLYVQLDTNMAWFEGLYGKATSLLTTPNVTKNSEFDFFQSLKSHEGLPYKETRQLIWTASQLTCFYKKLS